MQPYDIEVGAGTFHPATTLRSLGPKPWKTAYVQPSRRPTDGRYGENPNRLQHYYQFQVLIKPSPSNIKRLYLNSLSSIGISHLEHDIRFVEDDWESPTLGAAGLGWDVNASDTGSDFDLDVSVFMLGASGKIPQDKYFVFYNNREDFIISIHYVWRVNIYKIKSRYH